MGKLAQILELLDREYNYEYLQPKWSDFQIFGLRRSGNHAVIDWMMPQCQKHDRIMHYNNVRVLRNGEIQAHKNHIAQFIGPNEEGGIFRIFGFEDTNLLQPPKHIQLGIPFIVLRDPFNTFASRLRLVNTTGDELHSKANLVTDFTIELWKQYAQEFLAKESKFMTVNFNQWIIDKDYRKELSDRIKKQIPFGGGPFGVIDDSMWKFSDDGFGSKEGWIYSGGSSFSEENELDLLNRWKHFEDDVRYVTLFDDEIIEMSREIFGEPPKLDRSKTKYWAGHPNYIVERAKESVEQAIEKALKLIKQENYKSAEALLQQTLKVQPDNAKALQLLGIVQNHLDNYDSAIQSLQRAIELDPDNAEHHNNLALSYANRKEFDTALAHAEQANYIEPENPIYMNNLGLQYLAVDNTNAAISLFKESLGKKPDPLVMVNLGTAFSNNLEFEKAAGCLEDAIDLKPDLAGAHVNLFYNYQLLGKHEESWEHFEHRLQHYPVMQAYLEKFGEKKLLPPQGTTNVSFKGQTLVVFCEQGYGDAIQFMRFIPMLKRGCKVVVCCSLHLASLFEKCEGVEGVVYKETMFGIPHYDYHLPIMSIPYLLNYHKIPDTPYIKGESTRFVQDGNHYRVGICWKGNPNHPNDSKRSVELNQFFGISQIPGVRLYSLQKASAPADQKQVLNLNELLEPEDDFGVTAGLINSMDLVISVDTAVLHLAGAMGKEAWGLIPRKPDWRWGLDERSPWYPTIKLYRQEEENNWRSVFKAVKEDLKNQLP
jgi:tetratricopeptide (TPR) repeat protein